MQGSDGISRPLYVAATGRRVVIVRVFVKRTRKTPSREIDLAMSRAKEVLP
jgi:phage-related protein